VIWGSIYVWGPVSVVAQLSCHISMASRDFDCHGLKEVSLKL
jgi:hypothetical protein